MSKPTQTRRCPTCGEEFVSDERWDEIDDCPDCVAEDPNEGLGFDPFLYGNGASQEPTQRV